MPRDTLTTHPRASLSYFEISNAKVAMFVRAVMLMDDE
jgi:hypothetical protein